ncbi:hypothetical protein [Aerosakkonema funiforme]|uniref:hypothetical protein n=1 Tax=Aerosakkonema funiforme TaxID=1246630 RepID=UPI0035B72C2B
MRCVLQQIAIACDTALICVHLRLSAFICGKKYSRFQLREVWRVYVYLVSGKIGTVRLIRKIICGNPGLNFERR